MSAKRLAEPGRLRECMLALWQKTRIDWRFVTDNLPSTLRKTTSLGGDDRRLVTETLFGMIRHLRRIDEALGAAGLAAIPTLEQVPDLERLLAYLVLESDLSVNDAARCCPQLDWHAVADIDNRLAGANVREGVREHSRESVRDAALAGRVARLHSLPDWLAATLVADCGDRALALAAALNTRAPSTIRANTLCTNRDDLAAWLAEDGVQTTPGSYAPTALHVATRTNLFGLRGFRRGGFEMQDEGSQLVAALVAPPPRALVVDYCAGAGGKTLALAAALGNRGRIVAADVDARKLRELRRRARRAGVTNVQSVLLGQDGSWPGPLERLEGTATRVLIDAPCSGIGALRRHPEVRWRLTAAEIAGLPQRQHEICERALALVAPGGHLIYATCTVLKAENQAVVERLLAEHPNFEIVPAAAVLAAAVPPLSNPDHIGALIDDTGNYVTTDPARHGMDGFFVAVLRRR